MSGILFADVESASVEENVLTTYEQIASTTLYPGDPVRLFLESLAYTIALQNNVINLAGRQNLLAYAEGEHLDYIGMMVGTPRQGSSRAACRQAFYLDGPLAFDVPVPAGTRVTTGDGKASFATCKDAVIAAGATEITVAAEALEAGAFANGLVPGQINQMINPVPYIARTANVTASLLGSDIEGDERYRSRIQAAPEAFSCAGPAGAYRHYTLASHPDIADVSIYSPEPGTVDVRPVLKNGELPTEEILEAVSKALNAENVRPLTDTVTVQAPELVYYNTSLTWYLDHENEFQLATVTRKVAEAVENYRLWQRVKPGRDILPIKLTSLLYAAGVKRLELAAPQFQKLESWQLARERSISVTFGGVE